MNVRGRGGSQPVVCFRPNRCSVFPCCRQNRRLTPAARRFRPPICGKPPWGICPYASWASPVWHTGRFGTVGRSCQASVCTLLLLGRIRLCPTSPRAARQPGRRKPGGRTAVSRCALDLAPKNQRGLPTPRDELGQPHHSGHRPLHSSIKLVAGPKDFLAFLWTGQDGLADWRSAAFGAASPKPADRGSRENQLMLTKPLKPDRLVVAFCCYNEHCFHPPKELHVRPTDFRRLV